MAKATKKSKLKKRLQQASALLVLIAILVWIFKPSPIPVHVSEARIGSFSDTVELEGKTQARRRVIVWAPVAGIPQRMPLAVGEPVVVQQIVARLVSDPAQLQSPQTISYLTERAAAATAAKARALAERAQTAAAVNPARENLRNADALAETGMAKVLQRDRAQVAMKLIFKELDSMDASVQSAAFDIEAAQTALRQIQNTVRQEWVLHAPINGTVLAVVENGKPVAIGATLVEIGNPLDLEVIVETNSSAAAQVSAGQRVLLKADGADELPGRVRRVEITPPTAAANTELRARIAIEFAAPPAKWQDLGNNRALKVHITLATIDNVLKIPAKALIADGQQNAVFIIENGRARKRIVTLTARDIDTVVVESGIKENQRVIVSPGVNIKDGVRVKSI